MTDRLHVAVGVIQRRDGCVLVGHRDARRHQGGGLEFPGGKLEPGESIDAALERELLEETQLRPTAVAPWMTLAHCYAARTVTLHVRRVTDWISHHGFERANGLEWRDPATLSARDFPDANRPLIASLRLPPYSPVTPRWGPDSEPASSHWLDAIARATAAGDLVRVRSAAAYDAELDELAQRLQALDSAADPGAGGHLLVNASPDWIERMPRWVGLHLSARATAQCRARPISPDRLVSCACHDATELARAAALDADLVYVGPVKATPTHPGVAPLGWAGLRRLAEGTSLPIYAIGGLERADLARARAAGAIGVAGIRGFWAN